MQDPSIRPMLESVRSLLIQPDIWIKGAMCRDKRGKVAGYWDSRACRFSLDGALQRVGHITGKPVLPAYEFLCRRLSRTKHIPLAHFNDAQETTLVALITFLNEAIVTLGGETINPYGDSNDE